MLVAVRKHTSVKATKRLVSDQSGVPGAWPCHCSLSAVGKSFKPRDSHSLQVDYSYKMELGRQTGEQNGKLHKKSSHQAYTHWRNLVMRWQNLKKSDEDSSFLSHQK